MFEYHLEHLCSYTATLDPNIEVIGPTPDGLRMHYYVTGGEVIGPKLRGKIRPVGADWFTLRRDGVGVLDVRATIETDDGALIYVSYRGITDVGEGAYEKVLQGEFPAGSGVIHTSPVFQTSHPSYQWLHRVHCLGVGQSFLERMEVAYDIYAVRAGRKQVV
jgi:hypothetical protein